MRQLRMARTDPQLNIRIPVDLKERLEQAAAANGRSVTSELLSRLRASFVTYTDEEVRPHNQAEALMVAEPSRWPWPDETLARVEEKLGTIEHALDKVTRHLVEGIESGELGTAGMKMSPAAGGPTPRKSEEPSVTSAQPYKPGESLPRPPLTRYPRPRK